MRKIILVMFCLFLVGCSRTLLQVKDLEKKIGQLQDELIKKENQLKEEKEQVDKLKELLSQKEIQLKEKEVRIES
ncbi:MAG: hypothetical protein NC912_00225 [Candidatus Omnitrophica bacterium]|nr:hypothetical protein [Candidatus Omnitrophota bacterium]